MSEPTTNTTATLFDRPLARDTDPQTSHDAAYRMVKSGALSRQEQEVLKAIKMFLPLRVFFEESRDFTAKELSYARGINYYKVQRRLSDLNNHGKIRRISVNNNGKPPWVKRGNCCVWELI